MDLKYSVTTVGKDFWRSLAISAENFIEDGKVQKRSGL